MSEVDHPHHVDWCEDTHGLVHFECENSSSIVPLKRVERQDGLCDGDLCSVIWSNNKKYPGILICSGSMEICAKRQEEDETSDEDTVEQNEEDLYSEVVRESKQEKSNEEDTDGEESQQRKKQKMLTKQQPNQEKLNEEDTKCEESQQPKKRKIITKKQPSCGKGKENKRKNPPKKPGNQMKCKSQTKKAKEFEVWIGKPSGDKTSAIQKDTDSELSSFSDDGFDEAIKDVPKHYTSGRKKQNEEVLQEISKICKEQESQFRVVKEQLQDISNKVQSLTATNVAAHLIQLGKGGARDNTPPSTSPSRDNTYSTPSTSYHGKATVNIDKAEQDSTIIDLSTSTVEVKTSPLSYSKELLTSADITPIYVKSQSRRNFAALLVKNLFDVQTRMQSNVAGRGKEQLDPEIMQYIKAKVFEYYECNSSEIKEEWAKCIVAIDEKSRALKRLKRTEDKV